MRAGKPKLTPKQKDTLFRLYKNDRKAARELALEYGVTANYASVIARQHGYYACRTTSLIKTGAHHLWARAKAVGPVVA
jgi:hypothetical protein